MRIIVGNDDRGAAVLLQDGEDVLKQVLLADTAIPAILAPKHRKRVCVVGADSFLGRMELHAVLVVTSGFQI